MRPLEAEVYKAADGWRWRVKAPNGRIVADSAEAYQRRIDCVALLEDLGVLWHVEEGAE